MSSLLHDYLAGEQASCKSTTTEVVKRCIDPRRPMLGSPPVDTRDLVIIASNTWVLAFDNLTAVRPWLSDALCRLAYGVGFETRALRTDDELVNFESCRPIIVNGIDQLVTKLDLLSRAVILNCPTIDDHDRRREDELWRAFQDEHPRILGAILDAIVGGLVLLPSLPRLTLPRMADFGHWGEAVSRHLGWPKGAFLEAFFGNQQSAAAELLEDSPLVSELRSLGRRIDQWEGTAGKLFEALSEGASTANRTSSKWPRGPQSLACHLKRLAPALRRQGISVVFAPRLARSRLIQVAWNSDNMPAPPSYAQNASFASFASSNGNGSATSRSTQGHGGNGLPF